MSIFVHFKPSNLLNLILSFAITCQFVCVIYHAGMSQKFNGATVAVLRDIIFLISIIQCKGVTSR